ncbi:MAG: D-aminoacyl-tRNA deacylase [Phycisphaerae bacterium]
MRAVVQRVSDASVTSASDVTGAIKSGLLVYLGVDRDDGEPDVKYLVEKIRYVRIFPDEAGKLNLDVAQATGSVLVVSAFTTQADARRGRRPSFDNAAPPEKALVLYEMFCNSLASLGVKVERGKFGHDMQVYSINAGPVCLLMESRRAF